MIWEASSWPWIEGTNLEDHVDPADAGFFHATTRFRQVMAVGLKSRRQLREMGAVGLGGGYWDMAPDVVSFVPEFYMANALAEAMVMMAHAVRGEIGMDVAAVKALEWMEFPHHSVYQDVFELTIDDPAAESNLHEHLIDIATALSIDTRGVDPDELTSAQGWRRLIMEQRAELASARGPQVYEGVQEAEEMVQKWFWPTDSDMFQCAPFVGFTATAEQFSRVNPCNIGVVWADVRENATVDLHTIECELRVRPEDLRVAGGEEVPCYTLDADE